MSDERLAGLLRAAGDPGDPHADLYRRRLHGPPALDAPGPFAPQTYGPHRQHLDRCEIDGDLWPCYARRHAPGHYQPGRAVRTVDEAVAVIARHTELDGHCTACGEEWMCATRQEARRVCQVDDIPRPMP